MADVYGGSVPLEVQELWTAADTSGVPQQRPGSTWNAAEAQRAAQLANLFYGRFLTTLKASQDLLLPDGSIIESGDAYWACDPRLCADTSCSTLPTLCNPTRRAQIVGGMTQWLGGATQKQIQQVIGTDTTLIGTMMDAEPSDVVRGAIAAAAGSIPIDSMLIQVYGKPGEFTSWTVNALLRILGGWPAKSGYGYQGQVPSYHTMSAALQSLNTMATQAMPVNIRIQIQKFLRQQLQGFTQDAQGNPIHGKDIRLTADREGPWTPTERNELYKDASFLAAKLSDLPEPSGPPSPIPNPWQPPPDQIPDPGSYPPPRTGIFGKRTNLIFGIAAAAAAFIGAGALIMTFKRRKRQQAPLALSPLGRIGFPSAARVSRYVRRR